MITLDTSVIIALFNARDSNHQRVSNALLSDRGPFFIPAQIMAEIAFVIDSRLGHQSVLRFLDNLQTGKLLLDCGDDDIERIRELVERYADMPLGFADAAVIASAERHGGKVLTLDERHFNVVARDTGMTILP